MLQHEAEQTCGPKVARTVFGPNDTRALAVGQVRATTQLQLVAGARYAQRCPVEFGVPMEVVIAA